MSDELKIPERSFRFAVRIVRFCRFLERHGNVSRTLAGQLLRSATSIGANVEEAQAGQSKSDFIAKMSIVRQRGARNPLLASCACRIRCR
ncbi:four helix bundle protein [Chlorobaculum thiosulfatiphilum]|uniref:four helix bundle protein n=1 Tax=Chlorobaculum thiosulfatiphilum TaxID=115852 RepID=UPI001B86B684